MADGYLYELELVQPARFRAASLDVAARVARAAAEAAHRVLLDHPGVILLEDAPIARANVMRCSGARGCRAPLHQVGCPAR